MVKELRRKCSCGNNGRNAKTCNCNETGTVKFFGVDISKNKAEQSIKRSFGLGNLKACDEEHNCNVRNVNGNVAGDESGYLYDGLIHNKKRKDAHERKKGVHWSVEEHRTFLAGIESVGKGKWRETSRHFVRTRTPAQVASHAQKYFLRKTSTDKKKSSLFDKGLCLVGRLGGLNIQGSTAMESAEISSQENASISQTLWSAKLANHFPCRRLDSLTSIPNYPRLVGYTPRVTVLPGEFGKQNISARNTQIVRQ